MALGILVAQTVTTSISLAGHLPPLFTNNITRRQVMLNSRLELSAPPREPPCGDLPSHRRRRGHEVPRS